jgi:triacylglycerol lipase
VRRPDSGRPDPACPPGSSPAAAPASASASAAPPPESSAADPLARRRAPWFRRLLAGAMVLVLGVAFGGVASAVVAKRPVIIVAGTLAGQPVAPIFYKPLAEKLRADGYETRIYPLPWFGLGDIRDAAAKLAKVSDEVRESTGAGKVHLIGHSQGGLVARYYVKELGGADKVESVTSLAAPHHGTATASLLKLLGLGTCLGVVACKQMSLDSAFLAGLNAGDDTVGDVRYVNIGTKFDEIVIPYTSSFLDDDGNNVNVTVQDQCGGHFVEHAFLTHDSAVYGGIQDALTGDRVTLRC